MSPMVPPAGIFSSLQGAFQPKVLQLHIHRLTQVILVLKILLKDHFAQNYFQLYFSLVVLLKYEQNKVYQMNL